MRRRVDELGMGIDTIIERRSALGQVRSCDTVLLYNCLVGWSGGAGDAKLG